MDAFTKHSHKSRLRARRRNDTASNILRARIENLEQGYQIKQKSYNREKTRIQTELLDLTNVNSEPESRVVTPEVGHGVTMTLPENRLTSTSSLSDSCLVLAPGGTRPQSYSPPRFPRSRTRDRRPTSISTRATSHNKNPPTHTHYQSPAALQYFNSFNELTLRSDALDAATSGHGAAPLTAIASTFANDFDDDNSEAHDQMKFDSRSNSVAGAPTLSRSNTIQALSSTKKSKTRSERDKACRFSIPVSVSKGCPHFPCSKPMTYHTMNFRRDDLGPWVVESSNERFREVHQTELKPIVNPFKDNPSNLGPSNTFNSFINVAEQDVSPPTLSQPAKKETKQHVTPEVFNPLAPVARNVKVFPPITGPYFSPAPSDPILEHIRRGLPRPPDICTKKVKARSSVKDKLRGLKHLVCEMRARNESIRPRDWTVNYGERVPDRVLLNPVVARRLHV